MMPYQAIFATRQALRIAAVRLLLTDAGVTADPQVVYPEELERVVGGAGNWLVIVDGQALPQPEMLLRLRHASPGSCIVIWTDCLTTDLLLATIECGLNGLLSSELPHDEAVNALSRICRGERLLRFDSDLAAMSQSNPSPAVAEARSFDAQWMLHGVESQGREP